MNTDVIRNWLNIIFMIGAVVGLVFYFTHHKEMGIYIILVSMVVKFAEATLRMFKV
ncbi:MAG: hypothetical protein II115_01975 [Prevotella sp.]|jgi:hypothetical protein|nr:hypothetical protein [Muribaculaceae bacterium]MBQ1827947.1 hypothetical protein [Prevotella sp.]MBQ5495443.1 hypothetical protein [Prevotella sp.]MBQ5547584.1 hypothetical protein [Prevotella sp.]